MAVDPNIGKTTRTKKHVQAKTCSQHLTSVSPTSVQVMFFLFYRILVIFDPSALSPTFSRLTIPTCHAVTLTAPPPAKIIFLLPE